MQVTEDFELPPLEQDTKLYSEETAATQAFYGAATIDSEDPVSNFQTIKTELTTQGYSTILDSAKAKWEQEQDEFGREYFTNLISDPNVDLQTKKNALSLYASSGYISKSLKDKYIENIASKSIGTRLVDEQAQDELLKTLQDRRLKKATQALVEDTEKGTSEIGVKNWAQGLGYVGLDVVKSIPASIWGALQGIWDRDLITGQEVTNNLLQSWKSDPKDPATQEAVQKIASALEVLAIPYDKAFSYTLKETGSEQLAIASGLAFEALTGTAAIKAIKSAKKGVPKLKKGTPLDETITANPKVGSELAAAAVNEPSGQMAAAVGEDAGTIVSNMVFPKPYKLDRDSDLPSIHKKLTQDIAELDKMLIKDLEDFRWDPSIHNASLRRSDYETIVRTTKEVDTPTYQPSNSTISPTNTSTYVGKAVFGRDTDLFYHSRSEVINAYDRLIEVTRNIPEEFNTKVSIVDRLTGEKYTPESLRAEPKFKSGLDKLNEIPTKTESGIPVRTGNTDKTRPDGTYVAATLKKNPDGSPKEIVIDTDTIKKEFATKPWTSPKVEGVTPLPARTFKTPEEWAKFVYLHEEAHVLYPNTNGILSKAEYENLVNQKALEKFNTIKNEAWQSPALSAKQFAVEMEWNREYDDLGVAVFGTDAIDAKLEFGTDVSGLARSSASQWIFGGTGIFPEWFEKSGARSAPRAAKQAAKILGIIKKKIASTPYKKELNYLVNLAEEKGIENFSFSKLQDMFPDLKKSEVESLYETHTYWRRVNHFNHHLINLTYRNELVKEGFTKGLYIEGKYKGAVKSDITFGRDDLLPRTVWDMDLDIPIEFTRDISKDTAYDIGGKQLVQLKKPVSSEEGKVFQYALVGSTKSKVDLLPDTVVPRIPGYSPIKTTAAWYIDIIPTSIEVNGYLVGDPVRLRTFSRTVGAGITRKDAKALEAELKDKYPDYVVQARIDRDVSFNRIMADQEAHQEILRNAMERGERLPTLNGPAPIEDRLTSLVNAVQNLTRKNSMQAYDTATQKAFVDTYSRFLKDDQFPVNKNEIQALPNMSPEETIQYQNALAIWDQYSKIKSFGSMGDRVWANTLNNVAEFLEKFNVTYKVAPATRELAKKGNILANYPRQLASTLFISLNAPRQWIVQPAQLFELWSINPQTAIQRLADLSAVRMAIASRSELMSKSPINWYESARALAPSMDKVEFDKTVRAIEESGILESVDLNMVVNGIFNDLDRPLIEGGWEKAFNTTVAPLKATGRLSRQIGFDFAELNNRIGIWLIMKDKWKQANPDKDWTTPEAINEISHNEWKWSGSMSKAGSYPYQSGAWSVLMQFAAITQKMTMNLIQKNGLLSPSEKARLVAARSVLWGAKYGVPGGALAYYFIDKSEDEEVKANGDILKRGLADRALNSLFNALSGSEGADLLVSKGMSPYSESTTGIPYVELIGEFAKLWDGKDATNPRLPAIGAGSSVLDAIGRMRSWFVTADVTDEKVFNRVLMEAFTVASGMNNFVKSQLMLSTKEKLTKNGNKLGLDFTASEAYAQMFGIGTWTEDELWAGISASMDRKERIDSMATNIHSWMENQQKVMKSEDPIQRFDMLTSFVTMLKDDKNWTDQDVTELYQLVVEKMKRTSKDTNTSLLEAYIKAHSDKDSAELVRVKNALRANPNNKELLDILDGKGNP